MGKKIKQIYLSPNSEDIAYKKFLRESESLEINYCYVIDSPNTNTKIDLRVILQDKAKFTGNVLLKIKKGAYGSNIYLSIKCLLLSSRAHANVVPSLEIKENEVKAGHAATLSYLETSELEYLMSRGLTEKEAEDTLIKSFLFIS